MTRRPAVALAVACLALAGCTTADAGPDPSEVVDDVWAQMTVDERDLACSVTADAWAQRLTDQGVADDLVDAEWAKHISTCG